MRGPTERVGRWKSEGQSHAPGRRKPARLDIRVRGIFCR